MNSSPNGDRDESGAYSSTTSYSNTGSNQRQRQQEPHVYSDTHSRAATALSPPLSMDTTMGYDIFEEPLHRSQGGGGGGGAGADDDDTSEDEDGDEDDFDRYMTRSGQQELSSSQHQLRSYAPFAEPPPPPPVLPRSPMVTPPVTRSYQRQTVVMEPTLSLAASNFKQQTGQSSLGTGAAVAAAATEVAVAYENYPTIAAALGVPHVYHDHSQVPDDGSFIRKKTGGVSKPFPEKLHEMLGEVETTNVSVIVGWLPHGRAFIVRKPKEFTEVLMPKYFKQTKLTSFQRQLNLYGFRRLTQGLDSGAYYHEMFLKTRPGLCQRMARQKVKGTGHKQPADAKTEPNFYEMRPVDETTVTDVGCTSQPPSLSQSSCLYYQIPATVERSSTIMIAPPAQSVNAVGSYSYPSPAWTFRQPPPGTILSPASPGLHGAAHMLQNIASGNSAMSSSLRMPTEDTSLGPPAMEANSTHHTEGPEDDPSSTDTYSTNERRSAGSFLQPRLSSPFDFAKP